MDFLSFVNKGVEKSNKSLAAIAEVDTIFDTINADLKRYTAGELKLERRVSTLAQIASFTDGLSGVEAEYIKHDRIILNLKTSNGTFTEDVAGWKQRVTGYPCILKFDGQELSCGNASHLMNGMSELLASVGFGNAVNRLTNNALESGKRKTAETPKAIEATHLTLVKKPRAKLLAAPVAAKPAAKVAAKAAAAKSAAKPAAKSPIKPSAPKPTAKPAAKSPAKPSVPKPTAKPAAKSPAKPSAPKPATKPAAKSPAKPSVPKTATKPGSKSSPAAEAITGKASHESQQNEAGNLSH